MVRTFTSKLSKPESYFLYDIESGSLHKVDYATFLVAKNKYEKLSSDEKQKFEELEQNLVDEILGEICELEEMGQLNAPEKVYKIPFYGEIKAMCLHICHDCNLRCSYCFANEGTYNTPKDYMTFEVGKNAIDFLIEKSGNRKQLEVDFFGGEPLMNLDVVKQIVDYANVEVAKHGKKINFTMTTNGVLLNENTRQWLNDTMDNVVISIDGRPEIHDLTRVTANGKGSHSITLANAKVFRKIRGDKKYYVRGTFTQNNLDFSKDALYLNDQGFDQISLEPVVLAEGDPMAIKPEDMPRVHEEYDNLARAYIERRKGEKWFNFFHFMLDLKNGPCIIKRLRGCGAGNEYVAVSPIGELYPCHQFVGESEYYMGNVLTREFKNDIQEVFFENNVYNKSDCKNCIAKYYCSGGCTANCLHFSGDMHKPHKIACELMKKRFITSLSIYAEENEI